MFLKVEWCGSATRCEEHGQNQCDYPIGKVSQQNGWVSFYCCATTERAIAAGSGLSFFMVFSEAVQLIFYPFVQTEQVAHYRKHRAGG